MPEKSLPFFREKKTKQPNQPDPLSPQNSQAIYSSGPNLVLQEEILPSNYFYIDKFFKFFRKTSFFIVILFGAMLIVNSILNLKLQSQRKIINQLADEVGSYSLVEKQAIDVDKKIKFYENTLSQRYVLGDKAHVIFSNLNSTAVLNAISIAPEKFTMVVEVATPLDFAKLVTKYLESARIASITIHSADLVANKNIFKVSLEGTYK